MGLRILLAISLVVLALLPLAFRPFVLLAGACLGHLVLMVISHNWWYGQPLPRHSGKIVHLMHGLLTLAFPLALAGFFGWELAELPLPSSEFAWPQLVTLYVLACAVIGFAALPLNTVLRRLRRDPTIDKQSQIFDVAEHLGYRPVGTSKERLLTYLPGNEAFQIEMVERTLALPRLPAAWDGLTILHLSDLHLKGTPDREYFHFVMDRCADWEPDLVAVTGDITDSMHHMRWIVPVLGRLRWRVAAFAILGNHDHWYDVPLIRRRLRRLGMHVLANTWRQIEVRGQPLVVVGHEGPWLKPAPDLGDCPREPFRLCLSHTPDNVRWARRSGIDLMLSGHVHGGQVRFPLFGSVLVPSVYGRRYDCGVFDEAPTLLHVSRGVSGDFPLRYLCRPEVTRLTLRRV